MNNTKFTCLQQICGTLLYYSIPVEPTNLIAINALERRQTNWIEYIEKKRTHVLNYCATNP